jgi:hypothetical protein
MLENRGLMFLQLPYPKFKQKLIEAWVEKINREYHKKIEISLNMEREVMSLKKHPGAPEDFPQFAPMELL